ncbi:3-deoxy-manno-octulosonate-8-phosphatase KdsC [Snodgrassella alvi]|uniref:3-deoxy-D-manno-octulosonate 8-phosphate phosphatase KdsC n=1 Tax=Snodgrassella alvi TaxID=1196083 RepID=A0A855FWM2_9NEIS|nr:3-deoxy-manno-octulosonate-8-phosphatase KdsC [Snodgrassella alvi]PIT45255.1 phenylphosphate carboxylase subunit delta [Snodgrassella alvi]PIT62647.1 phenylphosphate carboxylase subunit delta [Snodgrassella alvi]
MISATALLQAAQQIRLFIMDVDGVLTDGRIFIRDNGEEIKAFHTLDGHGLKMLHRHGIQTAIITGRDAPSVGIRVQQLGIQHYFKGITDKRSCYCQLLKQLKLSEQQCAYIGDDVVDLPVMKRCGLAVAVPNAHALVLQHADYVTRAPGGAGAVREVCDLLLDAQGFLAAEMAEYLA